MLFDNIWFTAAIWVGMAFAASLISIRTGISVALVEIFFGIGAGNLGVHGTTEWIDFLAMLGSGVLTFLAGAEIDPVSLKKHLKPSLTIGIVSFTVPFAAVWAFTQLVLGWSLQQAQIAGIALSTTSVAVMYAVMIERGLSDTAMGKMLLAACFVTDFGTVLALGVLFADFNWWMLLFVGVTAVLLWFLPRWTRFILGTLGGKAVGEPELKFLLLVLFLLAGFATTAKSEAVLPAYLVGLVVAGVFLRDKNVLHKMRTVAFTVFTPFYFLKAGLYVSLPLLWTSLGVIAILLAVKVLTKSAAIWPIARAFRMKHREAGYSTLLMSTGLTFGTISSLFGLNNHIISQDQYTILVTVVILSAVIPTLIAQRFLEPSPSAMDDWEKRKAEKRRSTKEVEP